MSRGEYSEKNSLRRHEDVTLRGSGFKREPHSKLGNTRESNYKDCPFV